MARCSLPDLIDGKIDGWPVSIEMLSHYIGAPYYGAHCAAYTDEEDNSAPDEVRFKCSSITDACDGLTPSKSLRKAKLLGFVPDEDPCSDER